MAGFIKLHRGWHDSNLFKDGAFCERAAWAWLLSNAAWRETMRVGPQGNVVAVQEGQFHTSLRSLGAAWGWDKNRVSRFLKRATECGNIGTSANQGGLLITICNWQKYQGERDNTGTSIGTSAGQARDTQEESKEVKEGKKDNIARFAVRPDGVGEQVWADFVALRRLKRAPLTETAISAIKREAGKIGWPLDAALTECVARGWQGFKAEWIGEGEQLRPGGIGI